MPFFTAFPLPRHEIRVFQNGEMLGDSLPGHVQALTELAQRLSIPMMQPVQQLPAADVRQRAKNGVVVHAGNM